MIDCTFQIAEAKYPFSVGQAAAVFGRGDESVVVLDGEFVSRRHFEILLREGETVLRDLNSSNGTRVNGKKILEVVLHSGDTVEVGEFSLVFVRSDRATPRVQANLALTAIRPEVERLLPAGCTVNIPVCLSALEQMIRNGTAAQDLVSAFVGNLRMHPEQYLQGYREFLQTRAGEFFSQIERNFNATLPSHCRLNRTACTDVIESLLRTGITPDQLLKKFVEQLQATPRRFVDGLPEPTALSQFQSGAPHSVSRSECRGG